MVIMKGFGFLVGGTFLNIEIGGVFTLMGLFKVKVKANTFQDLGNVFKIAAHNF